MNLGSFEGKFRAQVSVVPRKDNAMLRRSLAKYLISVNDKSGVINGKNVLQSPHSRTLCSMPDQGDPVVAFDF